MKFCFRKPSLLLSIVFLLRTKFDVAFVCGEETLSNVEEEAARGHFQASGDDDVTCLTYSNFVLVSH